MKELLIKYARVLLNVCLKVERNQPLFISYNIEREDFVRIVVEEALKIGVNDIYLEGIDPIIKHDLLLNVEVEDLKKNVYFNKSIWNTYAKKNAAFLMLASENPGLMKDVDPNKLKELTKYSYETRKTFDELRDQAQIAWTIAAVPTKDWANTIYPDKLDAEDELWDAIFEICHITDDNPEEYWTNKIRKLSSRAERLTKRQFKKIVYKNDSGTNFSVELPKNHIWASGGTILKNGKEVLVNLPTEEVFTSPTFDSAEGIVYSSLPLSYHDVIINEFYLRFENGIVKSYGAHEGEETLKNMIDVCENANRLGEVALVPYDSPISNKHQIFLETLFDENASCHIALGDSFPECIMNGTYMDKDMLLEDYKMNKCDSHVDFMIGTKDLNINGITKEGKEVPIFISGNFSIEFE